MMMKNTAFAAALAAGLFAGISALVPADGARAAEETPAPPDVQWAHEGVFGIFDRDQLKRGWQVYKQVCAACHSVRQLYYRNLTDAGFTPAEVQEIAAQDTVSGELDDFGEPTTRPGRPSDHVASPYPNEKAAAAANGGAVPPDLSLMVKARKGGADYLHAILTGYKDAPAGFEMQPGMSYNEYFSGRQIAMPPPLFEGAVSYEDGPEATVEQMARDVSAFLAWAAEPELEERKRLGIKVLLFILVLTGFLYAMKRKIWSDVH